VAASGGISSSKSGTPFKPSVEGKFCTRARAFT